MNEEITLKLDNIKKLLDNDSRIKVLEDKKNILINDPIIKDKINKLNELDKYSSEYINIKKELFNNPDFVSFKELENEINFLILEINKRLKELTNERKCNHESN